MPSGKAFSRFILLATLLGLTITSQSAPPEGFVQSSIPRPDGASWSGVVGVTFATDGTMFAWERGGRIWILDEEDPLPNPAPGPLLDISDEVGGWRDFGLLGVTLDPAFLVNGHIYLLYVVDRHHVMNCSEDPSGVGEPICGPGYNPNTDEYFNATIGRITRYTVDFTSGMTVDYSSRKVLLGETVDTGIPILHQSHGTGSLAFGTDGTLIATTGDGASYSSTDTGSAGETYYAQALQDGIIRPEENVGALRSQMLSSLNGKVLRLDRTTGDGLPSNPFYDPAEPRSTRSRVWALGLRNPFRMTMRPDTGSHDPADGAPGSIYIGDVGWGTWEDLHVSSFGGENFGWPVFEGMGLHGGYSTRNTPNEDAPNPLFGINGCTQEFFYFRELIQQDSMNPTTLTNSCDGSPIPADVDTHMHTRPVIDWRHGSNNARWPSYDASGNAVHPQIGQADGIGQVVEGTPFQGNSSTGGVWYTGDDFPPEYKNTYFHGDYGNRWIRNIVLGPADFPVEVRLFDSAPGPVIGFATHPINGHLYYVTWGSQIRKVTYEPTGNRVPTAVASADVAYGASPLTVQFTGDQSTDVDGTITGWDWDFGDGNTSSQANPQHTFVAGSANPESFDVRLTVTDNEGATATAQVLISTNNTPPNVSITSPAEGTEYPLSGDTVYDLTASIFDSEHTEGSLACEWVTILHHNDHTHQEPPDSGCSTTTTISPLGCGDETYYFRVTLRVTDPEGLSATDEVTLLPDCDGSGNTNQPPTSSFTFSPSVGPAPLDVNFDASGSSDPDGTIVDYAWDFGDGSTGSGASPGHTYTQPGEYTVQLTVTDDLGLTAVSSASVTVTSDDWWNPDWTAQRFIAFDNSGISQNLVNFPVLLRLTPADVDYASIQPNGEDLRFIDADGATVLDHEIAAWNPAGESLVWVKVPQIDANSTTDHIWLYYGNPLAADGQNGASVWQGYAGVWHLDGDENDSSPNANHGTNVGTTAAAGFIGAARAFDGSSYIDMGAPASLGVTGAITIEAWVQMGSTSGSPRIVSKKIGWRDGAGYNLEYKPIEDHLTVLGSGSNPGRAEGVPLGSGWRYLTATISGSTAALYLDGVAVTTDDDVSALAANGTPFNIGRRSGDGDYFSGLIDEVRISTVARSAAWIAAQHRVMSGGFVSVGGGGPGSGNTPPAVTLTQPANGAIFSGPANITVSAVAADADGSIARVDFYEGANLIGSDATGPYTIVWPSVPLGTYYVKAVAVDDQGASTSSTTAAIDVVEASDGPEFSDIAAPPVNHGSGSRSVSWGDYDNDGYDDVFVADAGDNQLFRNLGDGTFADVTNGPLAGPGSTHGGVWGDYDNDGDLDLYVFNNGLPNQLLRNDGGNVFTDVTPATLADAGNSHAAIWGDYDNDGDLDLYLSSFDSPNRLWRNDNGSFTDVTVAPLDYGNRSASAGWVDYDNDGDLDLFLVIDNAANVLLRNDAGTFVDATPPAMQDANAGFGSAWGDYDNDGDLDLYVTNIGAANQLLRNDGNGNFTDVTTGALADSDLGFAAVWIDYDNDGDLDLFFANRDTQDKLLRNEAGSFADVTPAELADAGRGWGVGTADVNLDGRVDLYLANHFTANRLYRNDSQSGNNWLSVVLTGTESNRFGIGARVTLTAGGVTQIREVASGNGSGSQNSLAVQFGLGQSALVDELEIRWPSGNVQVISGITPNQRLSILEPTDGNSPPTVSLTQPAGGATFIAPTDMTLSADASDADGTIDRVDFYDGASLIGTDSTSPYSIIWGNVGVGSHTISAVAVDNEGATNTSTAATVEVFAQPTITLTSPADGATVQGPDVTFTYDLTGAAGSYDHIHFTLDSNPQHVTVRDLSGTYVYQDIPDGTHTMTVQLMDAQHAPVSAADSVSFTVENTAPANQPPSAFAGSDLSAATGETVHIEGSVTDDGLPNPPETVTVQWTAQSGPDTPNWPLNDADSAHTHVVFPTAGSYVLRLTADDSELTGFDEVVVNVSDPVNQPPVASIAATPTAGLAPLTVDFDASGSSDADGSIVDYAWEFGDGGTGSGAATSHIFSAPGDYTVTLTVTDDGGAVATASTTITTTDEWWDLNWSSQRKISFDNTGITENLSDFPVLLRLTPADVDYASIQPNGEDLRFLDADGATVLNHEIAAWNPAGESLVWVKVPQIDANSTTDHIWLYYGNPLAADGQDGASVWQGYAGVWHLDGDENDSSPNANHGTNVGTTAAAGFIGAARAFDGSSYIDMGAPASLSVTGAITIEAWVQMGSTSGSPRVVSKKISWRDGAGYNLEYKPIEDHLTVLGSGSNPGRAEGVPLGSGWRYLTATISGSTAALYLDGVAVTTDDDVSALAANGTPFNIGRRSGDGDYFSGLIDEVRISPVARSAAWIAAQHRVMSGGFVSVGTGGTGGGNTPPAVALTQPANGATFTAPVDITVSADAVDTDGSIARVDFYDGATLIGSDSTSPYSILWSNVSVGSHSLTAVAFDNEGATNSSSAAAIEVFAQPTITLTSPAEGASVQGPDVTFTYDLTGQAGSYDHIHFMLGGATSHVTVRDLSGTYVYEGVPEGAQTMMVQLMDAQHAPVSEPDSVSFNVLPPPNQPPVASIAATPTAGLAPLTVDFDASGSSDADGSIVDYAWEFGDGGTGSGAATSHIFSAPGDYTVTLTVTDDGGAVATASTTITTTDEWWDLNWSSQRKISFDNTGITENLSDFPVLLRLTPADVDYASIQPNGEDLRFIDADGATVLDHEIAAWNPAGESLVWVKVPQIDANSTTDHIWLYYGNPLAADGQNGASVWQGYAGVWHLDGDENDSSPNANHGTNVGTTAAAGLIGSARAFDGSSYIDMGAPASLGVTGAITIEAWVQMGSTSGSPRIVSKKISWRDGAGYNLEYKPIEDHLTVLGSGSNPGLAEGVALSSSWHYLTATISGSTAALYVDGVAVGTDDVSALAANGTPFSIGRRSGDGDYFSGLIDEVRISPVARSAAWIAAQHRVMNGGFVSLSQQ